MPTSASSSRTGAVGVGPGDDGLVGAGAVVRLSEHGHLADARVTVDLERDARGHLDEQLADAEVGLDPGPAGRQRQFGEVDGEVAHGEVVRSSSSVVSSGRATLLPSPAEMLTGEAAAAAKAARSTSPRMTRPPTRLPMVAPTAIAPPTTASATASATDTDTS